MKLTEKNSPNQNERIDGIKPFMLILHYTGTKNAVEADEVYMSAASVSPHYMVDINAEITKYVDEDKRAWHAGSASWAGYKDINSASIGIEVVNGGHDANLPIFPNQQITGLIELMNDIRTRWNISDHYILGHSDIAPGRKIDPGERFPWSKLNAAGIGAMPRDTHLSGQIDTDIELYAALKEWGYDYSDDFEVIAREFQRHYLPDTFGRVLDKTRLYSAVHSLLEQKKLTLT